MVVIDMDMPKNCGECPMCMVVKDVCSWCMAGRFPVKYTELDLRDGICPLQTLDQADLIPQNRADQVSDKAYYDGISRGFYEGMQVIKAELDRVKEREAGAADAMQAVALGSQKALLARLMDDVTSAAKDIKKTEGGKE